MPKTMLAACAAVSLFAAGSAQAAVSLTNAALFNADASGSNTSGTLGAITRGAWTTVLNFQNVPGNYAGQLYLSDTATPGGSDFFAPAAPLSHGLSAGTHTIYFWANGDDTFGGADTFGFNLFFNGAATSAPAISVFAAPGGAFAADAGACTSGYELNCVAGANTLSVLVGSQTVTLTDFRVLGRGGGTGGEDRVRGTNTGPISFPTGPDGVNDTYGSFTLTVSATGGIPEPAAWSLMIVGFGAAGTALRRSRRRARLA